MNDERKTHFSSGDMIRWALTLSGKPERKLIKFLRFASGGFGDQEGDEVWGHFCFLTNDFREGRFRPLYYTVVGNEPVLSSELNSHFMTEDEQRARLREALSCPGIELGVNHPVPQSEEEEEDFEMDYSKPYPFCYVRKERRDER